MRDRVLDVLENVGRATTRGVAELGFAASLLGQSVYWLVLGRARKQPVRLAPIFAQAMDIGIAALPIITVLAATIGLMLAIQGIYTLKTFGAESRVTLGVALSTVREFSPLITGILVAGRSGSALAARLGTMRINQEIDSLTVMGISPVRFLVVPPLVAMVVLMPLLTLWADLVGLAAAGLYIAVELQTTFAAYADEVLSLLKLNDLLHGLAKSAIFAVLVTIVGVVNGASVTGGAEGVGRMTTRSVVHAISAIVVTDMLFVFMVTR
ncbi:MlaE family ABC transporter permease [Magnetospirillum moscoviense]|uniref:ABC transporter n=1 Tax=Magnetospirillum moscoviense TaxID=1437059 RepID=A0A178MXB7_9PROT|nr:ABC transporter permease [Magnetospirillum moscoviense]MBF0325452.1 ABC transporter permease [Alphaproteobacteria bacterium]OAN55717.1 ABC transporter [Magnetospirillum moscoviense]